MRYWSSDVNPVILAVEMGYGHLRPAYALAVAFDTAISRMDAPPIADPVKRQYGKLLVLHSTGFRAPESRIHITGFPLPADLVRRADAMLMRRLRRFDPNSILHTFL
jgi:hypothetical protein